MPRQRPPFLYREVSRHGKPVWYVRRGKGPRIRIPAAYGTPEFDEAYHAALAGERPSKPKPPASGTVAWLIERYQESGDWLRLAPGTRAMRIPILRGLIATSGAEAFSEVTRATILAGRDRRIATPFAANSFLKAVRGLFRWAALAGLLDDDPTKGIPGFSQRTNGFSTWTEDDVARFEARWPIGTPERLAFAILRYTGLRRGDAAALGPRHVRRDVIEIATAKTGAVVRLKMPRAMRAIIAASRTGARSFVCTAAGEPYTKESFGNLFRDACAAAGVAGSAHGLRKFRAVEFAASGASERELDALFGWSGGRMAAHYTRAASAAALAQNALDRLAEDDGEDDGD